MKPAGKAGRWYCVEAHVKLEARGGGLIIVGEYADYAINAVFFENYWN